MDSLDRANGPDVLYRRPTPRVERQPLCRQRAARRGSATGSLERVVFNDKLEELRRESLLSELHQRIRDVRQGPDGLLYVITDEDNGALLRIEPAS